ncbi:MAG: hypothetical protein D6740_07080 [Alphaproteobacteria bacterium]|nr:MAG: hypothetical protein D6740_07080 [Alphaproteobacteria bacterium]
MAMARIALLDAIKSKMGWLARYEKLLSQNIANAETPGYKAKGLERPDFGALLDRVGATRPRRDSDVAAAVRPVHLVATSPAHFGVSLAAGDGARPGEPVSTEPKPNGNTVDLESELVEVGKAQMDYGLMVELYRKQLGFLRLALGRAPGR